MKADILGMIKDQCDMTNAVVLTHNIDFVFLQNLLLPALRRCGSPSLTVFADAQSAAETFALQAPMLSNLGRRYRVVPVTMAPGFRFHPKAVLLSGREKALLLVGSGNLTFGGWCDNGEIWAAYDSGIGTAEIAAFREYLFKLVQRLHLNLNLQSEMDEAFDPGTRSWAGVLEDPSGLIGRLGAGPPLLKSMQKEAGVGPVDRLFLSVPYFDSQVEALEQLKAAICARETLVVIDPEHTNLAPEIAASPPTGVKVRSGTLFRTSPGRSERRCFLHAKLYGLERGHHTTLFLGSANCSRAALTLEGERGNAELMAVLRLSTKEFRSYVVEEIKIGSAPPKLVCSASTEKEQSSTHHPRIVAAREQDSRLEIAFVAHTEWRPEAVNVDGVIKELRNKGPGLCECQADSDARSVRLSGFLEDAVVWTAPLWIDHEAILSSSSYRRSLYVIVRNKAWRADWELGDWVDVLEALCEDLEYMPSRSISRRQLEDGTEKKISKERTFARSDIFDCDLSLRLGGQHPKALTGRKVSFQAILLRWFDYTEDTDRDNETLLSEEIEESIVSEFQAVDRPDQVRYNSNSVEEEEQEWLQGKRDQERMRRVIQRMAETMSTNAYLESRAPIQLAQDLKIASLVFRIGTGKGWVEREDFLMATFRIWSKLFLFHEGEKARGWLIDRDDSSEIREALESPEVAAALFAWSLEIPSEPTTPQEAQLLLALALAVARHPWLWISPDLDRMASVLVDLLKASYDHDNASGIEARWQQLVCLGRALNGLEAALAQIQLSDICQYNRQASIQQGEIVYQGVLGFCVAENFADRLGKVKLPVLTLHGERRVPTLLSPRLLNPLNGLLQESRLLAELGLKVVDVDILKDFVDRLQSGLSMKSKEV